MNTNLFNEEEFDDEENFVYENPKLEQALHYLALRQHVLETVAKSQDEARGKRRKWAVAASMMLVFAVGGVIFYQNVYQTTEVAIVLDESQRLQDLKQITDDQIIVPEEPAIAESKRSEEQTPQTEQSTPRSSEKYTGGLANIQIPSEYLQELDAYASNAIAMRSGSKSNSLSELKPVLEAIREGKYAIALETLKKLSPTEDMISQQYREFLEGLCHYGSNDQEKALSTFAAIADDDFHLFKANAATIFSCIKEKKSDCFNKIKK
jgi:hypothetical protein